jgi:hypothetical protein
VGRGGGGFHGVRRSADVCPTAAVVGVAAAVVGVAAAAVGEAAAVVGVAATVVGGAHGVFVGQILPEGWWSHKISENLTVFGANMLSRIYCSFFHLEL